MLRRWMPSEDIAVRLADALDAEDGGRRLLELARRLGRTEVAVRRRACGPAGLRAARHEPADLLVEPASNNSRYVDRRVRSTKVRAFRRGSRVQSGHVHDPLFVRGDRVRTRRRVLR